MKYWMTLACLLCWPAAAQEVQVASLTDLTDAEKSYYAQSFSYAMETLDANKTYEWKSFSGNGIIMPSESFVSKSGSTCRTFSETFLISGLTGQSQGIGCKRGGGDGWCKLHEKQALTCAMEKPGNVFGTYIPSGSSGSGVSVNTPRTGRAPHVGGAPEPTIGGGNGGRGKPGEPIADTVTGTAGSVAGPATSGAIELFNNTFR